MADKSIPEFYAGQSIFLTGATGFLGKVVIEKLLRSCPKIKKIYILVRSKKGKSVEERLQDLTDVALFDILKESDPDCMKLKLKPVVGDVTQLNLGLCDEDKKELIENVSIIFHCAASVRFDDSLKDAILLNTRGTRETIKIALKMVKLKAFVHVSTTYCNTDKQEVEERLYPPHADWRKCIEIAENADEHDLEIVTPKYIGSLPNTYTFTKSLAEHVVYDLCQGKIPTVVFRPSIVIATRTDPVPGWIDNFNGPVGLLIASGKGIVRTCYTDPNVKPDYMPVDIAVRALLLAAWQKSTEVNEEEKLDVKFYNCSNNNTHVVTMQELIELGIKIFWEVPLNNILWYPGGGVTGCYYWNFLRVLFFHLLPATIIDALLRLFGKKPLLVKIQRRIYIANMALQYFITNQWTFKNEKCTALETKLLPQEYEDFGFNLYNIDVYDYFKNCTLYSRKYLFKEDIDIAAAKKNLLLMYVLDRTVKFLLLVFFYWVLVHKLHLASYVGFKLKNIYDRLS